MGELGGSFYGIFLHNSFMSILQDIFKDHYEEIKYTLHPRNTVMENIDKMINCGDPAFGGAMYGCPHCGKLKFVPFHYNRHEDDRYVEETIPVIEFIERLIRHIPEKHYKMIRYGGLYARHREIDKKLHRTVSLDKHHIYRSFNQWRTAILSAFGYDPLKCECGATMLFLELYFNHKRVSLEELYEKAMSRSRGRTETQQFALSGHFLPSII